MKTRIMELRKEVSEVFKYHKRDTVFVEEFYDYFKKKGLSEKAIERLWLEALKHEIIDIGILPILDPNDSSKIIEERKVFILRERWKKLC